MNLINTNNGGKLKFTEENARVRPVLMELLEIALTGTNQVTMNDVLGYSRYLIATYPDTGARINLAESYEMYLKVRETYIKGK